MNVNAKQAAQIATIRKNFVQQKQLLMFDFDGTLIDSVADLTAAVNVMMQQLDRDPYPLEMIKTWIGNGASMLVKRALSGDIQVDESLSTSEIQEAERLFLAAYEALDCSQTIAYPDVTLGLNQLHHAGFTLALVTNKPIRFVPKIINYFGWSPLFSNLIGGDSLPQKKPDAAPLLHTCQTLNIDPKNAVMIGDSINDILAGKNAGIDTIGLSYGYNYDQDIRDCNPNFVFDDFTALTEFLLQQNNKI